MLNLKSHKEGQHEKPWIYDISSATAPAVPNLFKSYFVFDLLVNVTCAIKDKANFEILSMGIYVSS